MRRKTTVYLLALLLMSGSLIDSWADAGTECVPQGPVDADDDPYVPPQREQFWLRSVDRKNPVLADTASRAASSFARVPAQFTSRSFGPTAPAAATSFYQLMSMQC